MTMMKQLLAGLQTISYRMKWLEQLNFRNKEKKMDLEMHQELNMLNRNHPTNHGEPEATNDMFILLQKVDG